MDEGVHGPRPNTLSTTGVGRPIVIGRPKAREGPDVQTLASHRTTDACLCTACWAEAHVPFRPLRLYILLPLLLSRVSKGLAHLRDRALLIHLVTSPLESTTSSKKIPQADSSPLMPRPPQGLLTERNLLLVSSFDDRVSLCVSRI